MVESCKKTCTIGTIILTNFADFGITTILFCHGNQFYKYFINDVYGYTFGTSMFDLWVYSLLRVTVLLGTCLAIIHNPKDSIERIQQVQYNATVTIVAVLMWSMTLIKMLVHSEIKSDLHDPWFWSIFGFTLFGSIMLYTQWGILGNIKPPQDIQASGAKINETDSERQPLLGNNTSNHSDDATSTSDKKKVKGSFSAVRRLLSLSKVDWYIILPAFIFLCVAAVSEIFVPFYTGKVIDGIAIEKDQQKFTAAIITMSLLSIGSAIATGCRGGLFSLAIARLDIRIRNFLFSSLLTQDVGFFDSTRTGEMTSRLTSDTSTMSSTLGLNTNVFLRSFVKGIGVCIFMFKLSWRLSMVTFIGLPIITAISAVYGEFYEKLSKEVQESLAKANEVAEETCSSIKTVRSFANELNEIDRYAKKLKVTYKVKVKEAVTYAGYVWVNQLFALGLIVGTLYYGGHLVVSDVLTGGTLVSFILYQIELGGVIEEIGYVWTGLMQAAGASEKVFEYVDREPEIPNTINGKTPEKLEGNIEFKNVTFSYPSRPDTDVLKNVSFSVKPGEVVALVGPSGGGKSSCVNLLEHFYETKAGNVLLDSVPIQEYDHSYLHTKIALVGQEPVLYARTIEENIAYGMEDIGIEKVHHAAKLANAHNFIMDLKEKYKTETGEKGAQLSGGQKQRVAIARALIRNPVILLLDEATSALDSESEHIVQQAIYNNIAGKTVIIIAHRLSTVERADRIVVIEKGQVVEQGTHKDLLQKGGMYSHLVRRQLLGFENTSEEKVLTESDIHRIDRQLSEDMEKSSSRPSGESSSQVDIPRVRVGSLIDTTVGSM